MIYVDTSALVKLVVQEAETAALQSWLESQEGETFLRVSAGANRACSNGGAGRS
jgi:predicted nucleic acid-binding protein